MSHSKKWPLGTRQGTGEKCKESGVWKAESCPSTTGPFARSNVFPPYRGKAVIWVLIQYA